MRVVISGFPGVGKTRLENLAAERGLKIIDLDSSAFSWMEENQRNPDFPQNYVDAIIANQDYVDYILVSSHEVVRQALADNRIPYIMVYPDKSLKQEYLARYARRGSPQAFIDMMDRNWDSFIDSIEISSLQHAFVPIRLQSGKYLSDIIKGDDSMYRDQNKMTDNPDKQTQPKKAETGGTLSNRTKKDMSIAINKHKVKEK